MHTLIIRSLLIAVFLPIVGGLALEAGASEQSLGGASGERLHYKLRWLGVPSGVASLMMDENRYGAYALQATVSSTGAARVVRAIDDQLTTGGRREGHLFIPHQYIKEQRRNHQTKWITYPFDWLGRQVLRTLKVQRDEQEQTEQTVTIPLKTDRILDPVSAFYAMRAWTKLRPNQQMKQQVLEGEKIHHLTIRVGDRELLQTELGEFSVITLRVAVKGSKTFQERKPIVVWLTDDQRRMPVQLKAQLAIGSVVAELVAFDDGRGEHKRLPE